jgi:hypothetical protein
MTTLRDIAHERHYHVAQYHDGECLLCHAVLDLHEIIAHGTQVPWADEDYDTSEILRLIRLIKREYAT